MFTACSLEDEPTDETGGAAGASAGTHQTGGSAGSGGKANAGAGGVGGAATGGTSGTSGTTGGTSGTGGTSTSGGTGGAGGNTAAAGGAAGSGTAGTTPTAGTSGAAGGSGAGGLGGAGTGGAAAGGSGTGGVAGNATGGAGASAGGAAGSGGKGSTGYQPCPTNGDPCKILPLGDSITWGIQYDGAYRVKLFELATNAEQKITFTGSVSNGPNQVAGVTFPKSNEGHSGWTIDQIAGLVPDPAFDTVPHIVLLMIGTNDIYASSGQAQMPQRLGALLDKIITAAPDALVVCAKITPLSNASWNDTIKTYNDAIPGLVEMRASAGKHIVLGDMNTGFTSQMLSSDSVHPNKSGYDFMGEQWYEVIGDLLPK